MVSFVSCTTDHSIKGKATGCHHCHPWQTDTAIVCTLSVCGLFVVAVVMVTDEVTRRRFTQCHRHCGKLPQQVAKNKESLIAIESPSEFRW